MVAKIAGLVATATAVCVKPSFLQGAPAKGGMIPYDGYYQVGCFADGSEEKQRIDYRGTVEKQLQKPMTPLVCFNFCRNQAKTKFFGLTQGKDCYCMHYPELSAGAGGQGSCTAICAGDSAQFCGDTKGKASIYQMHRCGDLTNDAEESLSKASEINADAIDLNERVGFAVESITKAAQNIDVTETRQLVFGEMKQFNELLQQAKDASKAVDAPMEELEKEVDAYSPDGATSDMMQKIEEGERKLAEISAKELDSYNKLKGLFRDHDLASTLAFHGVTQADIEKKATATGGPIDTAISRISPAAKAKIAEKKLEVGGYFVVGEVGEHLNSFVHANSTRPTAEWHRGGVVACYELCSLEHDCVAGNVFGSEGTDGYALTCNLKKGVKKAQLLKKVEKPDLVTGFIMNTYFNLNVDKIEFNTANLL